MWPTSRNTLLFVSPDGLCGAEWILSAYPFSLGGLPVAWQLSARPHAASAMTEWNAYFTAGVPCEALADLLVVIDAREAPDGVGEGPETVLNALAARGWYRDADQLLLRRLRVEVAGAQTLAVRRGVELIRLRVPPRRPLTQPLSFEDIFRRGGDFIQRGAERPDLTRGPPLFKGRAEVLGPYRVNRLDRSRTDRGLPFPQLTLRRQPPTLGLLALTLLSQTPLLRLSLQPGPLLLLRARLQRPED
ncbi:DUF317 domain-containing protein [Streptomyces sp. NPDC058542]|uniref:DUF317 domain-containing protein n=1 Tax=Streptomyces sp. NPDC058542 TaxID=3346543 RepID=UPI003647CCAC